MENLISMTLTDSHFSHDEFVSVNNVLYKYDDIKKEIQNLKTFSSIYKQCYGIV